MFAVTLKSWHMSLWTGLARMIRHSRRPARTIDVERLSGHMLRDLGISQNDAGDLLAAERTRFLS